jgi:short subunit fatty acids transporter
MGNLVSPFWAVVAGGIARIDFRRFIGYMIAYSALWFLIGVLAITFVPS